MILITPDFMALRDDIVWVVYHEADNDHQTDSVEICLRFDGVVRSFPCSRPEWQRITLLLADNAVQLDSMLSMAAQVTAPRNQVTAPRNPELEPEGPPQTSRAKLLEES